MTRILHTSDWHLGKEIIGESTVETDEKFLGWLLRLCEEGLLGAGLKVLRHHLIAPNDGGIALGQAVVAASRQNVTVIPGVAVPLS